MSLKFMQRAMAAEQKPVQAEAAEILDDSKWVIARSPEEDALHSTSSSKCVFLCYVIGYSFAFTYDLNRGFEVTYEPSYMPFLFEGSDSEGTPAKPIKGRRVFGSGQNTQEDVEVQNAIKKEYSPVPETREEGTLLSEGELDYGPASSSPSRPVRQANAVPSTSTSLATTMTSTNVQPIKNQFLRPSGVDVPQTKRTKTKPNPSDASKRDLLTAMIASSKASKLASIEGTKAVSPSSTKESTPSVFTPAEEGTGTRRKAVDDGDRPRKKMKKQKSAAAPA